MRKWERACVKNTWTTYRGHIHTYIQKYSDFLVYTISVGLAQARPDDYLYCIARIFKGYYNIFHESTLNHEIVTLKLGR